MRFQHWVIFGFAIVALIGMILALTSPSSADQQSDTAMEIPDFQPPGAVLSPVPAAPFGKMMLLPKHLLLSSGTILEDFENPREWTRLAGLAPAANKTEIKDGAMALKVSGGKTETIVEKKVHWDLSSSLQMRLWVYHPTKDSSSFEFSLAIRPEGSAFLTTTVSFSGQGWNLVQIGQGEFISSGGAQWTQPVTAVRFKVKEGEEFTFDSFAAIVQAVPVVMIDFDDADESAYSLAYPVLQKYGIAATAYVVTAWVGTDGHLSVPQLLEGLVDQTRVSGGMLTLLFHHLNPGKVMDGGDWNTAMFDELMAYLVQQKIAVPAIADFYRLGSQDVRIRAAAE